MIPVNRVLVWPTLLSAAFAAWTLSPSCLGEEERALHGSRHGNGAAEMPPPEIPPARRVREGTSLQHVPGTFQVSGDRILFCPADGTARLPVLENLALERVWQMIDELGDRAWSVSGTLTEYRGRNFLLIERAVVRSGVPKSVAKSDPPEPRS
ncbi:MAG: hypothetical protein ACYC4U_08885 [Pirellulaceae bacterium]